MSALTRKLGPLPAWAWLAIFAGAVYFYRRFTGAFNATPSSAATTDTGGTGGVGQTIGSAAAGGSGDGGLPPDQPSQQTAADPSLSHVGTPVVFDPTTGNYGTLDPNGNFVVIGPDKPGDISPDAPASIGGRGQVAPPVPFGGFKLPKLPKLTLPSRPKKTTGTQSSAKPSKPKPRQVTHQTSRAHTTVTAPARQTNVHAPAAVARPRAAASAPVNIRSVAAPNVPGVVKPPAATPPPRPAPTPVAARGSSRARLD